MAKKKPKTYVVYRGRRPGVYYNWAECKAQTNGFSGQEYYSYNTTSEASRAWDEWNRKESYKSEEALAPESASRPLMENVNPPAAYIELPPPVFKREPKIHTLQSSPYSDELSPLFPGLVYVNQALKMDNLPSQIDTVSYPTIKEEMPNRKRPQNFIDLTSDPEGGPAMKRPRYEPTRVLSKEKMNMSHDLPPSLPASLKEKKIKLSEEQEKVAKLVLKGENVFLTGAAGCGKTVTLKEILRRLAMKKKKVQVVAPTGIAALPLGGRTTYSFAGWNPDSFHKPMSKLLQERKKDVIKAIQELDVLVVEEISMVEGQFLERLSLLFQHAIGEQSEDPSRPGWIPDPRPFGGKKLLFLGDFHQLPPVKPFSTCLACGELIPPEPKPKPCCINRCNEELSWGDKWAFRAPVWKDLGLRHVKLEQIHRQKDTRFQDILNKIRDGETLSDVEWHDLESRKDLPPGAFAVRLMSRLAQVKSFNETELAKLRMSPKTWEALDASKKLINNDDDSFYVRNKKKEYKDSLRDHKFLTSLTLKVGARVVLLYNLDHTKGLVNGSQGTVIGFKPVTPILEGDVHGDQKEWRASLITQFQDRGEQYGMRPLVRFANGITELVPALAACSMRGGSKIDEQYFACRTQIPLTLAWALSIHKSQGMTLEYVEVSSKDIFESGQLYVALSRATSLDGLNVTGFSREQLPMDKDVLEFYKTTKWEKFRTRGKQSAKQLGE